MRSKNKNKKKAKITISWIQGKRKENIFWLVLHWFCKSDMLGREPSNLSSKVHDHGGTQPHQYMIILKASVHTSNVTGNAWQRQATLQRSCPGDGLYTACIKWSVHIMHWELSLFIVLCVCVVWSVCTVCKVVCVCARVRACVRACICTYVCAYACMRACVTVCMCV